MRKEEVQIMSSKNSQEAREGRNDSPMRDIPDQVEMLEQEESTNHGNENHSPDGGQDLIQVMVTPLSEPDLGATIRRLRESRQLSLKEVAARSGLTQSFLSQVERNLTSPSVASLRKVALAFGVPLTALFQGPVMPENRVVRRDERKQLIHPRRQWRDYLLTPSLTGKLQVILSVIEPGGGSGDEPYAHDSDEECVIVLRGRLEFRVGSDRYMLEEGDSIVFESRIPHWNRNPGPEQAEVLWITTPPSY
jgi:transcriptional regulator with XRE-family HTH domain